MRSVPDETSTSLDHRQQSGGEALDNTHNIVEAFPLRAYGLRLDRAIWTAHGYEIIPAPATAHTDYQVP